MVRESDKTFVLLHSPLVGPYTWQPVAEELRQRGLEVVAPSLLPALAQAARFGHEMAALVAQAVARSAAERPLYLVVHSAAGAYLPLIRAALAHTVAAYIFVDARLPKDGATLFDDLPAELSGFLRASARDGLLPPWSEWFGPEAMAAVLPDETIRHRFLAELPAAPLALFTEPIPVFAGWPEAACGYLHLSGAYGPQTEAARVAGWPVLEMAAAHLHMLVNPTAVSDAVLELAQKMTEGASKPDYPAP